MYRKLITLLLYAATTLGAPQSDSKITYIKRQIDLSSEYQPELDYPTRDARIDQLPQTLPDSIADIPIQPKTDEIETADEFESKSEKPAKDPPIYNYSDRIYSIKNKPKKNNEPKIIPTPISTTETVAVSENAYTENVSSEDTSSENSNSEKPISANANSENTNSKNVTPENDVTENASSDIIPSESKHVDTLARNNNSSTEFDTDIPHTDYPGTETLEDLTTTTESVPETTKAPTTKFLPKLSHYGKTTSGPFSHNLISTSGKRRFRSRCRCEKIWNCAKLQISVPRCPEEYFLCCS